MFVLVKSGWGGVLDGDATASGHATYDDAFREMQHQVAAEARNLGVDGCDGEYGCDYDSGHGFAGAANGPEFQIFSV